MSYCKWSYSWEEFITTDFSHFGGLLVYSNNLLMYNFYQDGGNYYILEKTWDVEPVTQDIRKLCDLKNKFASQRDAQDYLKTKIPTKDLKTYKNLIRLVVNNCNLQ